MRLLVPSAKVHTKYALAACGVILLIAITGCRANPLRQSQVTAAAPASPTLPASQPSPTPTPQPVPSSTPSPTPEGLAFPVRAAYYSPIEEPGWSQVQTRFTPLLGHYSTTDSATIRKHIRLMQVGGIQAGIIRWQASSPGLADALEAVLEASRGAGFAWAVAIEEDVPLQPDQVRSLLDQVAVAARNPAYLKVQGKPVLFARAGCQVLGELNAASRGRFHLGFSTGEEPSSCTAQPDFWIPVPAPGERSAENADAAVIRPGAWAANRPLEIYRHPLRWQADIEQFFTPEKKFQIVDSFNNWQEGTAVEPAREWTYTSPAGLYLDILGGSTRLDPDAEAVLAGAGDISVCDWPFDDRVSDLFRLLPGDIFTLGDNSNEEGSHEQYQRCFADSWGRFFDRIHPSPGNHDYLNPGAQAYFEYYGDRAGEPGKGYYSYDLGAWHIVSLNGNCSAVGGCQAGSPQETWLRADLASHPAQCSLAYWHQPRWSSGLHGGSDAYADLWQALYDNGLELVMNGHDHHYERFAPQDPSGQPDEARGIRQFISGTGGAGTRSVGPQQPNSQVLHTGSDGLLVLALHPQGYEWQFIPAGEDAFTDWGYSPCH